MQQRRGQLDAPILKLCIERHVALHDLDCQPAIGCQVLPRGAAQGRIERFGGGGHLLYHSAILFAKDKVQAGGVQRGGGTPKGRQGRRALPAVRRLLIETRLYMDELLAR